MHERCNVIINYKALIGATLSNGLLLFDYLILTSKRTLTSIASFHGFSSQRRRFSGRCTFCASAVLKDATKPRGRTLSYLTQKRGSKGSAATVHVCTPQRRMQGPTDRLNLDSLDSLDYLDYYLDCTPQHRPCLIISCSFAASLFPVAIANYPKAQRSSSKTTACPLPLS